MVVGDGGTIYMHVNPQTYKELWLGLQEQQDGLNFLAQAGETTGTCSQESLGTRTDEEWLSGLWGLAWKNSKV